jgi:hypothetical protein
MKTMQANPPQPEPDAPSPAFDDVLKKMLETPPDPKVKPQPEKAKPAK